MTPLDNAAATAFFRNFGGNADGAVYLLNLARLMQKSATMTAPPCFLQIKY